MMGSIYTRSLRVLSRRDQVYMFAIGAFQSLLSLLDLAGVAIVGFLGALTVNGVSSRAPGSRTYEMLSILGIQDFSFQRQVVVLGVLAATLLVIKSFVAIIIQKNTLEYLSKKSSEVSINLFQKILNQDYLTMRLKSDQQIAYAVTEGVSAIAIGVVGTFLLVFADLSLLIVLSLGLFFVDPVTAIITVTIFALMATILYLLMHKKATLLGSESVKHSVGAKEIVLQSLVTYKEILVGNKQQDFLDKFSYARNKYTQNQAKLFFMPNISKYVVEIAVIFSALILSAFQFFINDASRAVAIMAIFLAAGSRIAPAFMRVQQNLVIIKSNYAAAQPTLELFEKTEDRPTITKTGNRSKEFVSEIIFQNVSFAYPDNGTKTISDFSVAVKPGRFVAIVGPSGAGKSTLVDLALGVLRPTSGDIYISGNKPRETFKLWPGSVSYVPQNVQIIQGSVASNVAFGINPRDVSDTRIWKALKMVNLDKLVESYELGLEQQVGEMGLKLSGGEKQRLALARALYNNPKLLILDEATSAMDSDLEFTITQSLQELKGDVTFIVVAHRLSTIINCDLIIYINVDEIVVAKNFTELRNLVPNFDSQANLMGL